MNSHPALAEIYRRHRTPKKKLQVWEWAEKAVRKLPGSPLGTGYDSGHLPPFREVMEAMNDPSAHVVVAQCAVQGGKTLSMSLAVAYGIVHDPLPTIVFQDQDANAKDFASMNFWPLMEEIDGIKELLPTGPDKTKKKITSCLFNHGMPLWILGGSNPRARQRRPAGRIYMDECHMLPKDQTAIEDCEKRTTRFPFPKLVLVSQGADAEAEFTRYWESTDKREWCVRCLNCGELQPLKWDGIEFEAMRIDEDRYDYAEIEKTARWRCGKCEHEHEDTNETRRDLNENGRFVASNPDAPKNRVGFRVSALSFFSWGKLACEYLRAKQQIRKAGDYGPMRVFVQKRLAESFGDGGIGDDFDLEIETGDYTVAEAENWEEEAVVSRIGGLTRVLPSAEGREGAKWARCRFLTVDCQLDHFWVILRSWSQKGKSRLIYAGRINYWRDMEALRERYDVHPNFVFVDSGFAAKGEAGVYAHAAKYRYSCLKGSGMKTFRHKDKAKGRTIERYYSPWKLSDMDKGKQARFRLWSNLNVKDILAALVQQPDRFTTPVDIDEHCPQYRPQMQSERRVFDSRKQEHRWEKKTEHAQNHLWDCEAEQVVGALLVNLINNDLELSTGETLTESQD